MKITKNLKIGQKLGLAFFIMLVIMMVIGIMGYRSSYSIQQKLHEIFDVRLPAISLILEADRDLHQLLVAERSMIFINVQSDDFKELINSYDENFTQSETRFNNYTQLKHSDEEKVLIDKYKKARQEWQTLSRQVVEGRLEDTRNGRRLALDLTLGQAKTSFDTMRGYLDQLTEINIHIAEEAHHEAEETYNATIISLLSILAIGILIGILLAISINSGITSPLRNVVKVSNNIAGGDFSQKIQVNRRDEIGTLGDAFNFMINEVGNIISRIRDNSKTLLSSSEELSALSTQMAGGSEKMLLQSNSVAGSSEQLSSNINLMAATAEEISVNITNISSIADQMSRNVESVAGSMQEMSGSINSIKDNAEDAADIAKQAAEKGDEATRSINTLNISAKEISKVTNVIKRIADQTNLLALNATIEAASAGEAGKGFTVVANEIKALADQSAGAADNIAGKINSIIGNIDNTVNVILDVSKIINKIHEMINDITYAVVEQNSVTNNIAGNINQVANGVKNIAVSISEVAKGSNELSLNTSESAKAVINVAENIQTVNLVATESNQSSQLVNQSAKGLTEIACTLEDLVVKFDI